ncbi:hypothetical protein ASZ97_02000 [Brucella melitensis]|nr:hypothetical protein ASZ97_02000 [Brucella melitensis]
MQISPPASAGVFYRPAFSLVSHTDCYIGCMRAHPEKCETVFGKDARQNKGSELQTFAPALFHCSASIHLQRANWLFIIDAVIPGLPIVGIADSFQRIFEPEVRSGFA